eukprot:Colp12_sorted_trinity150504_noHs@6945
MPIQVTMEHTHEEEKTGTEHQNVHSHDHVEDHHDPHIHGHSEDHHDEEHRQPHLTTPHTKKVNAAHTNLPQAEADKNSNLKKPKKVKGGNQKIIPIPGDEHHHAIKVASTEKRRHRRSTNSFSEPPECETVEEFALRLQARPGEHPLETPWTFWYDRRTKGAPTEDYKDSLVKLGSFKTVEEFWRHYTYLVPAGSLPKGANYHMFRGCLWPMWESFPGGGCWIVKFSKDDKKLGERWESLLFATIGELFEEPAVVGVVLSIRLRENLVSVWNRATPNPAVRFRIGERLRQVLQLPAHMTLEYKDHQASMEDQTTYRFTKAYLFADNDEPENEAITEQANE